MCVCVCLFTIVSLSVYVSSLCKKDLAASKPWDRQPDRQTTLSFLDDVVLHTVGHGVMEQHFYGIMIFFMLGTRFSLIN